MRKLRDSLLLDFRKQFCTFEADPDSPHYGETDLKEDIKASDLWIWILNIIDEYCNPKQAIRHETVVSQAVPQATPNGEHDGLFCESVFVVENGKWICKWDNPSSDCDFEPLKQIYLKAKNLIEGSRLELYAPLNIEIE